jgi:hypothetical protein
MYINDIIWLPDIVEKLAWKHGITPDEIDEVLFSRPIFRKVQKGIYLGKMSTQRWDKQREADI